VLARQIVDIRDTLSISWLVVNSFRDCQRP
jgi:hypothetical protein